ncbi:endonuclease domain-containing protein [Oceanobacillus caeni]
MELIEYIVFFGLAGFALLLYAFYKPKQEKQIRNAYVPDIYLCESPIERRLYNGLLQHGLYATPQYKVGKYRLDFAFPQYMIAIECDGKAYHSTPKQKAHDKKRDIFLKENGWTVLRFSGRKIYRELPSVVNKIKDHLHEKENDKVKL